MKRISIILMLLLCCAMAAVAVPAKQGWQTITQSDGTTLRIRAVGNAFNHAILTDDGLMVARGADGDYYYKSSLTGLSTMRAHEANQRTSVETAFINAQQANLIFKSKPVPRLKKDAASRVGGSNEESGVPAMGQRKIPIVLVEFKDKSFNNTREQIINAMLTGNSSVGQYFRDQSNGLYDPDFEVYGIYTLSQNREFYGGHSGDDKDKGLGYMVTEACQMAAAQGVSFKPYDTNNDDFCDVVIVIYAGVGEAQAWWNHPEAVWPCNWNLSSAAYYGQGGNGAFRPSYGDPYVDTFAVFNELNGSNDDATVIDGIGTFAHEFGHCLGLPDFYDTGSGEHYGMGSWDIMDTGCYGNNGYTPVGYSAYEKVFMGWIDYITPLPGTYYTLPPMNQKSAVTDKALCITSSLNANEYFIIENRKRKGWDSYIPGEGIMITHVTYDADRWWYNSPNNEDIQLMTLMNADNNWSPYDESTDLWPLGNKRDFTDNSTPPARLNMNAYGSITGNAGFLGKPVTEMVINQDGTASFWYMKGSATGPVISVSTDAVNMGDVMMNHTGTATFKVIGQALTGDVTLTLNDPNGVFSISPAVISASDAANNMTVTVTFEPTAIMSYQASVTLSSPGATNLIVNLKGKGLIESYVPVMQPADSAFINLTQFRADWTDQTPAQNVESYTLEVNTKPQVELLAYLNGSNYTGDYVYITLPEPWGGSYVAGGNNAVYIVSGGSIYFTVPEGYDNDTFTLKLTTVTGGYGVGSFAVSTPQTPAVDHYFTNGETYSWLVTASAGEAISIYSNDDNYSPDIAKLAIYSGDATQASLRDTETEIHRLITGITDKFYTVTDLIAEGTYVYKVKAFYSDGTESPWSNKQEVTLFQNGPAFLRGDVNGVGGVDMDDLAALINYLLDGVSPINTPGAASCNDADDTTIVDMDDLSTLINYLLTGTW